LLVGCLAFYAGCGETGNPQDPKNAGTQTGPNPTASPTPNPTQSGEVGEKVLATGRTNTYDLQIQGQYIYWNQRLTGASGGIYRVKHDGTSTEVETVDTGDANLFSIAIVGTNDLYYTLKTGAAQGSIKRKTIGSTTAATTYVKGLTNPIWIRYNNADGYLYWLEYSAAGGALKRVQPALTDSVDVISTTKVETICNKFINPFSFVIDSTKGLVYVGEFSGSGTANIWVVSIKSPINLLQTPSKIYSGPETQYVAALLIDSTTNYLYWTNYAANSGVWRVKLIASGLEADPADGGVKKVETGLSQAFDLFGLLNGKIYYSLNTIRINGGSIYSEDITKVNDPAVNALGSSTTATYPFRFTISGGAFYWTEYYDFNPTDLDSGSSTTCRVMKYVPPAKDGE